MRGRYLEAGVAAGIQRPGWLPGPVSGGRGVVFFVGQGVGRGGPYCVCTANEVIVWGVRALSVDRKGEDREVVGVQRPGAGCRERYPEIGVHPVSGRREQGGRRPIRPGNGTKKW